MLSNLISKGGNSQRVLVFAVRNRTAVRPVTLARRIFPTTLPAPPSPPPGASRDIRVSQRRIIDFIRRRAWARQRLSEIASPKTPLARGARANCNPPPGRRYSISLR